MGMGDGDDIPMVMWHGLVLVHGLCRINEINVNTSLVYTYVPSGNFVVTTILPNSSGGVVEV